MIEIKERATLETKGFTLDFKNNPDLDIQYRKDGKEPPIKTDSDISKNTEDLARYPVVFLDGVLIQSNNIKYLTIKNDSLSPSFEMEFSDPTSKLLDENYPLDNSIVSIFKESSNKDLMAIRMDFKILNFNTIKGTTREIITLYIDGTLDVDGLYLNDFESYKGTSYNTLKLLSKNLGLGFATNINETDDDMIWINPSNYKIQFMKDIIDASYIDDTTFLFGYIDFYYNFNYVDIEKQLNEDISQQMNMMDRGQLIKDGKENEVPLILTNIPDAASTNLYISKYTVYNSSTYVNLHYGYRQQAIYYNITNDEVKKYNLDNISNEDGNNIVLKGNPDDKNGLYDNMVVNNYLGKMDENNVHKNYLHTKLQNKNNLKFLQKLKMVIKLTSPNYSLYRFQKILVELYNNGKIETKTPAKPLSETQGIGENDGKIIHKLSGEWLITAINYTFSISEGNIQEITLVKRELTEKYTFPRRTKNN